MKLTKDYIPQKGDKIKILSKPKYWSSSAGGISGLDKKSYPAVITIDISKRYDNSYSLKDTEGYGWHYNSLIEVGAILIKNKKTKIYLL